MSKWCKCVRALCDRYVTATSFVSEGDQFFPSGHVQTHQWIGLQGTGVVHGMMCKNGCAFELAFLEFAFFELASELAFTWFRLAHVEF